MEGTITLSTKVFGGQTLQQWIETLKASDLVLIATGQMKNMSEEVVHFAQDLLFALSREQVFGDPEDLLRLIHVGYDEQNRAMGFERLVGYPSLTDHERVQYLSLAPSPELYCKHAVILLAKPNICGESVLELVAGDGPICIKQRAAEVFANQESTTPRKFIQFVPKIHDDTMTAYFLSKMLEAFPSEGKKELIKFILFNAYRQNSLAKRIIAVDVFVGGPTTNIKDVASLCSRKHVVSSEPELYNKIKGISELEYYLGLATIAGEIQT
ncbi:MAG: hypothetical protein WCF94_02195 [bacterium]